MEPSPEVDVIRCQRERDLYRRLLDLGAQRDLRAFLREALALVVDVTGTQQGYLELHDDQSAEHRPQWWIAEGYPHALICGIVAPCCACSKEIVVKAESSCPIVLFRHAPSSVTLGVRHLITPGWVKKYYGISWALLPREE